MYEIVLVVTMTLATGGDYVDNAVQPDMATCRKEAADRQDRFLALVHNQEGHLDVTSMGAGCVIRLPEEKGPPA